MDRRKFIRNVSLAGVAATTAAPLSAFSTAPSPFDQAPLPYDYKALEPIIDAQTMEIHYTKHAAAYSNNLKDAAKAENVPAGTSVEKLLGTISRYSAKMRNNGGGHYNHELFWQCMKPGAPTAPSGKLLDAIQKDLGSLDVLKTKFADAAKTRFGSGWAWLYLDNNKKLQIGSTPNQDNPLMDVSDIKGIPLLGLDVWEHAYYLKYQNRRPEYIENWWKLVNWEFVGKRYNESL